MAATAEDIRVYDDAVDLSDLDYQPRDRDDVDKIERHLLACCMWDDSGLDEAMEIIDATDFQGGEKSPHARVFLACTQLRGESRRVTAAEVYSRLKEHREDGDFKATWFAETASMEPGGYHARYFASLVREASLIRSLRKAVAMIVDNAEHPRGSAIGVIAECEKILFDLSDTSNPRGDSFRPASAVVHDALNRVDERQKRGGKLEGISTGYVDLDSYLNGLRPSQLTVIGARPSVGKTALGLNIAVSAAEHGTPVLFFSLEMPESELADRMLSMRSGVSMHRLTKGERLSQRESEALCRAAFGEDGSGLASCPIYIDDTSDQPAARIFALSRRAVRRLGVKLIIVDYLQLLRPENTKENRSSQVGQIANSLRKIARECKVPVVALAQLNRDVENRNTKPRLSDLRESGEIECHAHAVLLLHRGPNQNEASETWSIDVIVGKNRNGPTGEATLAYRRPLMRFENAAPI